MENKTTSPKIYNVGKLERLFFARRGNGECGRDGGRAQRLWFPAGASPIAVFITLSRSYRREFLIKVSAPICPWL